MVNFRYSQKSHLWLKQRDLRELCGKKAVIVGCGSVGLACAKRLKAFDVSTIGINRYKRDIQFVDSVISLAEMDQVLPTADIVIITFPLTNETRGLFDASRISALKDGAVLVNIARGALVDTDALVEELKLKRIYAVLDVFEEEPLKADSPLWDMDNVIITPHNSFVGEGNGKRMTDLIMNNLEEYCGSRI